MSERDDTSAPPVPPAHDTLLRPVAPAPTSVSAVLGLVAAVQDKFLGSVVAERYEIVRKLGEGGMASVYLARHKLIGRMVAVKVLHPGFARDLSAVQRFLNEGRAAGTLGHPNIIESTDMGATPEGAPFLVLEYLEGTSLEAELARVKRIEPARAVRIALQIASAVAAAHAAGIIHRDLKPANVFLVTRGDNKDHVKVLDFGVSKFSGAASSDTQQGLVIGTPHYMAPEQIRSPDAVDQRLDVYALGINLYEMLTGQAPFQRIGFPEILVKILGEAPPSLASLSPHLPPALTGLIDSMIAKDRELRPFSMKLVEDALRPFAQLRAGPITLVDPPPAAAAGEIDRRAGPITLVELAPGRTPVPLAPRPLPLVSPLPLVAAPSPASLPASPVPVAAAAAPPAPPRRLWPLGVAAALGVALLAGGLTLRASRAALGEQETALARELSLADARLNAARLAEAGGDAALDHLLAAKALSPSDARVLSRLEVLTRTFVALGDAAAGRGDFAEAAVHYQGAVKAAPERVQLKEKLRSAEEMVGRPRPPRPAP